tara:strand:- start:2675 stop:3154 length:480 start_codon:yes stop_codon:yes gene_type:complete
MSRKTYSWDKVQPGDIISFRYPSSTTGLKLHTLLVFGVQIPYKKKDGSKTRHLAGMKLEERNVSVVPSQKVIDALQQLGKIVLVEVIKTNEAIVKFAGKSANNSRGKSFPEGDKLKGLLKSEAIYRTYDFDIAHKYGVYLEPIILQPKLIRKLEGLNEN